MAVASLSSEKEMTTENEQENVRVCIHPNIHSFTIEIYCDFKRVSRSFEDVAVPSSLLTPTMRVSRASHPFHNKTKARPNISSPLSACSTRPLKFELKLKKKTSGTLIEHRVSFYRVRLETQSTPEIDYHVTATADCTTILRPSAKNARYFP
jgi:hypothetical protein